MPLPPPQLHLGEGCVEGRGGWELCWLSSTWRKEPPAIQQHLAVPLGLLQWHKQDLWRGAEFGPFGPPERVNLVLGYYILPWRCPSVCFLFDFFFSCLFKILLLYSMFIARNYRKDSKNLSTLNIITSKSEVRKSMLSPINVLQVNHIKSWN